MQRLSDGQPVVWPDAHFGGCYAVPAAVAARRSPVLANIHGLKDVGSFRATTPTYYGA